VSFRWFRKAFERPMAADWSKRLEACEALGQVRHRMLGSVLTLLRGMTLDSPDLPVEGFRTAIDALAAAAAAEHRPGKLETTFEGHRKTLQDYCQRQKEYLTVREKEFKDIIDLLTQAVAASSRESREFGQTIYRQTEQFEQLARLEDVKKIKLALKGQVEQMRSAISEKQAQDTQRIERLSQQVDTLQSELQEAQKATPRDPLTGAYTVQAFDQHINYMVARDGAAPAAFALLVIDIDQYQKIEQTYGRTVGERVVLAVSREFWRHLRSEDFLARYKQGTFVILMPGERLKRAAVRGRQICKTIAGKRWSLDECLADHVLGFSVSIGVSALRRGDTAARVIGRAVNALQTAKRAGRNRVVTQKARFFISLGGREDIIEPL